MKKNTSRSHTASLSLAVLLSSFAWATDYYASPTGNGNGSITNPWSLATALASAARPGDTIWLRGGTYAGSFTSNLTGSSSAPIIVRQYPGERAIIDGRTSPDVAALTIGGSYAWYWGFEVMNSDPVRILGISGSVGRAFGVVMVGPNTKAINLIVHDTGEGFSFWTPAANSEVYGNIVFYNGWDGSDRGHGHGVYVQNQTGSKLMADNIVFDQFSFGFHAYAEGGYINNLTFDGNISFNNGAPSFSGYTNNLFISASNVALNPVVQNNATYYTQSVGTGYNTVGNCSNANINNNYFVSGYFAISLPSCNPTTMAGNTFIGTTPGWIASAFPNNSWSATGLKTIVRPNRYEPGRANIAVFNWNQLSSVSVDISTAGLALGQTFEIRDVQNYLAGPVVTGTYTGALVSLPMAGLPKAPPIGSVAVVPPHTSALFGAFVLLPTGASTPPVLDTVPPTVAITSPGAGATASGNLTIKANASDNVGVVGVQFQIDNADIGAEVTASPYSVTLNTTNLSNGPHSLTAIARDSAGNRTTSAGVSISVSNSTGPTPFVTSYNLSGTARIRNDFSGWVGMRITMGGTPVSAVMLGRVCVSGNSGAHTVKFVNAIDGSAVPGGSVSLNMAGCVAGQFAYAALASPVTLEAGASYYLVTQEVSGGDQWYDKAPLINAASIATVSSAVYFDGANWVETGAGSTSYVPPNFKYPAPASDSIPPSVSITSPSTGATVSGSITIAANAQDNIGVAGVQFKLDTSTNLGPEQTTSPYQFVLDTTTISNGLHHLTAVAHDAASNTTTSTVVDVTVSNSVGPSAFLTGYNLNGKPLRNNFSGWVGLKFTVGATPITLNSLGRLYVAGNTGTHIVKLVRAADATDVPGGSVSVSMTGGTSGQFKYAALGSVIVLLPNTSYYLVSQEANGGDQWYDYGTVSSTSDAVVNNAAYFSGSWNLMAAGSSYVPANFTYVRGVIAPPTTPLISGYNLNGRPLRNNFSGWVGAKFTVGASAITVYSLGRVFVAGNTGNHSVKLVRASDGADVSGASATVPMSGGTAGQFVYAPLAAPVVLSANTSYYLVSQESAGGDQWYDYGTVSTASAATVNNAVWWNGSSWALVSGTNTSYVPPNLAYQ